jgi:hypothetical protein
VIDRRRKKHCSDSTRENDPRRPNRMEEQQAAAETGLPSGIACVFLKQSNQERGSHDHTLPPTTSADMRRPSFLLVIIATALLFPSVHTSSPASIPAQPMAYPSIFPSNITDSYRANWTSLSTSHIAGGETGTVRFELTDLVDSGYTLVDAHGASKSTTATTGSYANDDVRIVSGSWDIMIDVQSFGSKTVSQVIAVFKVFGVYNTASGRLVLQSVRESCVAQ